MATTTTTRNIVTNNPYMLGLLADSGATPGASPEEVTYWITSQAVPITFFLRNEDFNNNAVNDWNEHDAGTAIRSAFAAWEKVANVKFLEVFQENQANLVERINDAGGSLGVHTLPDGTNVGEGNFNQGGVWQVPFNNGIGGYSYKTLVHEIGHALGLDHPHSDGNNDVFPGVGTQPNAAFEDSGDNGLNQGIWTIMSYVDGWDQGGGVTVGGQTNRPYGWEATPMAFDIAAIQLLYGANTTTNADATVYTLPNVNAVGTYYSCIWDAGGGNDLIRATPGSNLGVTINLNDATLLNAPGGGGFVSRHAGIFGGFTIANGVVIEHATGANGNDTLIGNEAANTLTGGIGNDTLMGGLGADTLDGGANDDTYALGTEPNAENVLSDVSGFDTVTTTITRALTPWGFIEAMTLVEGAGGIWGYGNAINNVMIGNNSNNRVEGLAGGDIILGMRGTDTLAGGADSDTFRFLTVLDSVVGGLRDVITDLDDLGDDIIDLSRITGVDTYIGQANFTAAGQVRAIVSGGNVLIQINSAGINTAESEILLLNTTLGVGVGQFDATDLLL